VQIFRSRKSHLEDTLKSSLPATAVFLPSGFSSVNRFGDGSLRGVCVCVRERAG